MQPSHILVAVDGSEPSGRAVDWAAELAVCHDVPMTVVHVLRRSGSDIVPPELEEFQRIEHVRLTERDLLRTVAERIVDGAAMRATRAGAPKVETVVLDGHPATQIAAAAEDLGADLVVMGSRGLSNVPGMLLGSVSHRMLHTMGHGAVLTVR